MDAPDQGLIRELADTYRATNGSIRSMLQRLFMSEAFLSGSTAFRRYAWPVEFAVRSIKEVGWRGLSVDSAITPLTNMGQQLYEPPDVNGWALGAEWFSTASMLARMNYAATLAGIPVAPVPVNRPPRSGSAPHRSRPYTLDPPP